VIYTAAIPSDNPELLRAHERFLPLLTYSQFLGEISRSYKTVAIAGTHGKTTTTAMVAEIALEAGLDPTVVVGSYLQKPRGTNFIAGNSDLLIVEACEYKRNFLELSPDILVITNIEEDHLDYYTDLEDIKSAFHELALKTQSVIVCDPMTPSVRDVVEGVSARIISYSEEGRGAKPGVAGVHNVRNAEAALSASILLGVSREVAEEALEGFTGTWRRFEYKGTIGDGAILYDDYAHHPTEIAATIEGFRSSHPDKKLIILFQPHLYSRTKLLFDEFVDSLSKADVVYLLSIYAAREPFDESIHSEDIARELEKRGVSAQALSSEEALALMEDASKEEGWITMGAGDVYRVGEKALNE
jgi:UDP-N-acetylmuramate--alanine ligase